MPLGRSNQRHLETLTCHCVHFLLEPHQRCNDVCALSVDDKRELALSETVSYRPEIRTNVPHVRSGSKDFLLFPFASSQ